MFIKLLLHMVLMGAIISVSPNALWNLPGVQQPGRANQADISNGYHLYLPMVSSALPATRRANAPYIEVAPGGIKNRFPETGIFWFGKIHPTDNNIDVRVGYNNTELYIRIAIIDRRLWVDDTDPQNNLTAWDSAALYLNLDGNRGNTPGQQSYKFVAMLDPWPTWNPEWKDIKDTFRGNSSGWTQIPDIFLADSGWRGDALNNNGDDKGWAVGYVIPFSSLGLSGKPTSGTIWGMGVQVFDRDDEAGTAISPQVWPETFNSNQPATWGQLHFGLPTYVPPPVSNTGQVTIRHRLNGAVVKDAGVGGYTTCGAGTDYWNNWGDKNEGYYNPDRTDFNIQNQANVDDYPCFSKAYFSFPLTYIPPGKVIVSATLKIHMYGNSYPAEAQPSLIQVLEIQEDWNEYTITWNNAPLPVSNHRRTWVNPVATIPPWPGIPYEWDVSGLVANAYKAGKPLRIALYSADSAMHSGKYFVSSDTGDWNEEGRPTLVIVYGDPQ